RREDLLALRGHPHPPPRPTDRRRRARARPRAARALAARSARAPRGDARARARARARGVLRGAEADRLLVPLGRLRARPRRLPVGDRRRDRPPVLARRRARPALVSPPERGLRRSPADPRAPARRGPGLVG